MKKILVTLILGVIITTGAAFAQHPKGTGIGAMWSGNYFWGDHYYGAALTLKFAKNPLYWAVQAHGWENGLYVAVSGDKYFIDQALIKEANLGWYFGVGGYIGLTFSDPPNAHFGARLPVGLSWMPAKFFEVFLGLTPSIGVNLKPFHFPTFGFPLELGLRVWF